MVVARLPEFGQIVAWVDVELRTGCTVCSVAYPDTMPANLTSSDTLSSAFSDTVVGTSSDTLPATLNDTQLGTFPMPCLVLFLLLC